MSSSDQSTSEFLDVQALGWQATLAWFATGFLVLETVTGLAITFLPFSLSVQLAVVIHSAVGIPALIPLLWYLWRHWRRYSTASWTHVKVTGYLKSDRLTLDAYKGTPASFRPWNNQLRQPILLHTHI